ncbi:MAG: hypothetical protein ACREBB_06880 [Nitrosotalea sp.]
MSDPQTKKQEIWKRQNEISFSTFTNTEDELARKLGVSRSTITRDKRIIRKDAKKNLDSIVRGDYSVFYKLLLDRSARRSDELYEMQKNASNYKERLAAIREAREEEKYTFTILKDGSILDALEKIEAKKDE